MLQRTHRGALPPMLNSVTHMCRVDGKGAAAAGEGQAADSVAQMRLPMAAASEPTTRWRRGCPAAPCCAEAGWRTSSRWCGRCGAKAMLAFPAAIRIYVTVQPGDMRKSFNGLWAAAGEHLHEDPKSGAGFCFINRERTRLKLLYWDGTGVWFLAKRPEQGRFYGRHRAMSARSSPWRPRHWSCWWAAWS